VYCQLGPTTQKTIRRRETVSSDVVLAEVKEQLARGAAPDYVTLSGSGEPTLYAGLGSLIRGIRCLTDRPVAVLTSGALLWVREVQAALMFADLVIPSLDAGDAVTFQQVNRPHPELSFERVLGGLAAFRQRFPGAIWLEVLLLRGITSSEAQVTRLAEAALAVAPDRVQLNTVTRPPSEPTARAVTDEELRRAAAIFGDKAEIIAGPPECPALSSVSVEAADVQALLTRRPCTVDDVATGLGIPPPEAVKVLDQLVRQGAIVCRRRGRKVFYAARRDRHERPSRAVGDAGVR
jgi:wyosine [tRNA(Phe)-imidazoG37] synthetase (radical SAM superfamily)